VKVSERPVIANRFIWALGALARAKVKLREFAEER
jgi:hypothetical protein